MTSKIILSSGRIIRANRGVLGLSLTVAGGGQLFEGYDGEVWEDYGPDPEPGDAPLTADERREIAKRMIDAWRKWGNVP